MTERVSLELDTLTIRIPMRLQRRGGRKLMMAPEGAAMPSPKPPFRRDPDQGAGSSASLAAADRERSSQVGRRPCGAGGRHGRLMSADCCR
jgi:hypothetical protein